MDSQIVAHLEHSRWRLYLNQKKKKKEEEEAILALKEPKKHASSEILNLTHHIYNSETPHPPKNQKYIVQYCSHSLAVKNPLTSQKPSHS